MSIKQPGASNWKRKTLVLAIGAAIATTVSLPAAAATTTVSSATTSPITMTGTDSLSVTNTGSITITNGSTAVYVYNDAGITLTNDGTISVSNFASTVNGSAHVSAIEVDGDLVGTLTNNGTILAQGGLNATTTGGNFYDSVKGIYVPGAVSGTLTNAGTIQATYSASLTNGYVYGSAIGMEIDGGISGAVSNDGTISATATAVANGSGGAYANAYGLYIDSGIGTSASPSNATLTNSGTIDVNATATGYAEPIGVYVGGTVYGSVVNEQSGVINATGTGGGGAYVLAMSISSIGTSGSNTAAGQGVVTNNGTLSATAHVTGTGYVTAETIETYGIDGALINNGTITGTAISDGTGSAYIKVETMDLDAVINGNVTNTGTINAVGTFTGNPSIAHASVMAFDIDLISATGSIDNQGTITASVSGASGSNVYAYGMDGYSLDGLVSNSGTIIATAPNAANGYSLYFQSGSGMVSNLSGGMLSGNLMLGGSIAMSNAGTISVPEGAAAMVGGDYTQASGGTLEIGASSTSSYGTLTVGGTATINGTVNVNIASSNTLSLGDTLSSVVSAGTLSGNFSNVTTNNLLYSFTSTVNGNAIDLTMVKGMTPTLAVTTTGYTPALGLAGQLGTIVYNPASYPRFNGMIQTFGQMSSAQQMSNAISQLLPLFTGDSALIQSDIANTMNTVVDNRSRWGTGLSSGDKAAGGTAFWVKPFGSRARQSADGAVFGYRSSMSGLMVGTDGQFSDSTRLGGSIAYAHATQDSSSDVVNHSDQVYLMQLSGYGSTQMGSNTALTYDVAYGRNENSGRRRISFMNRVAFSNYASTMLHAGIGVEHAMNLGDATRFVPGVRLDYTSVKDPNYYERYAGSMNLNVDSQTYKKVVFGVGGRIDHDMGSSSKLTMDLGAGYDTKNQQASVTAALAGAPDLSFVTYGMKPSRLEWHGGVGVSSKLAQNVSLSGSYNYAKQGSFHNQTLSLKVNWVF